MSARLVLILMLAGWVSVGPLLSVLMGRRGFSPPAWGMVGFLLGPLALPLAATALLRRAEPEVTVLSTGAGSGPGPVAVLVGIDGSASALSALARTVDLLGERIGRLTLVYVSSVDTATDPLMLEREEELARRYMAAARRVIPVIPAEEYVVSGQPSATLVRLAADDAYDLVVIGPRGQGMSPRLFGSVARELAMSSPVPVLIGGQQPPPVHRSESPLGAVMTTSTR